MIEKQARKYFNSKARYFEQGLPPDRRDLYAIQLPQGGSVTAPETDILWERFWEKVNVANSVTA